MTIINDVNLKHQQLVDKNEVKKNQLKKACNEFVSILYQQMFESMQTTMKIDGAMEEDSSGQTDYAKHLFTKTMSEEVIKRDNNNLAEMLYSQMLEKSNLK